MKLTRFNLKCFYKYNIKMIEKADSRRSNGTFNARKSAMSAMSDH